MKSLVLTTGLMAGLSLGIVSCTKKLDQTNPSYLTLDTYFKNAAELQAGTNAIYSSLHSGQLVGREWFFIHDLRSDDVSSGGGQLEVPRAQILNGTEQPSNSVILSVWDGLYAMVHRSNTVIASAPNVTDNDDLRDQSLGEAEFLRAWAYFNLVTLWGPVPRYTKPVLNTSSYEGRMPIDSIYSLIVSDLKAAAEKLPATYDDANRGRATMGAANTMLGKAYMQMGDFANAKIAFDKVVNSGVYQLVAKYNDNFLEETEFNSESIFEAVFYDRGDHSFNWGYTGNGVSSGQTTLRNLEYCAVGWRNLIPSNRYLNEFENASTGASKTDPRLDYSVYRPGDLYNYDQTVLSADDQNGNSSILDGTTIKMSWRKYTLMYKQTRTEASSQVGGDNQRLLRYAEVLLDLAECENELGNTSTAVAYLNQLRDRADVLMPHYPTAQFPTSSKAEVMKAIMHEKTVEMGCEEVRNVDILRWRKEGYFTTEPISYFQKGRDELLPIPLNEINNNPNLGNNGISPQNPGY